MRTQYICTWLYADQPGEESIYAQMASFKKSSNQDFLNVYWKNIVVFFFTCYQNNHANKSIQYILYTNSIPPTIGDFSVAIFLKMIGVKIVNLELTYKTPAGYHDQWRNQFYIFSILDHLKDPVYLDDDLFLLLDCDCICTGSLENLFLSADKHTFIAYQSDYLEDQLINGISRRDMKAIYEDLLGIKIEEMPHYYNGEFYSSKISGGRKLANDFQVLWPILLDRNNRGVLKFNEEAHALSYLYYKNKGCNDLGNGFIKRMWTSSSIYRNIEKGDEDFIIWHLPHEKKDGILKLFRIVAKRKTILLNETEYRQFKKNIEYYCKVPRISVYHWTIDFLKYSVGSKIVNVFK